MCLSTRVASLILGMILALPLPAASGQTATRSTAEYAALLHFENKVRPLLIERCVTCHGPEKQRGGLRLDSPDAILKGGDTGTALVPGKSCASQLIRKVDRGEMPKQGPRLTAAQVAELRRWIEAGAPMTPERIATSTNGRVEGGKYWAFQKPDRQAAVATLPPAVRQLLDRKGQPPAQRNGAPGGDFWAVHGHRVRNPIDAFILDKLNEKGLKPAPPADRHTLVRRAYFDLLGLPPAPDQVEKFVRDPSPVAWEQLIDELLSSPQYGERWARHWLDVARYADSAGYENEEYHRNAWRYRDWVVKAFNDDKPYDRFVQEQLAADELWPDNLDAAGSYDIAKEKVKRFEARIGSGLFGIGPRVGESRLDAKKLRYEELTDWVDTAGSAFLGLTLGCARCHDHKFDPLTQRDYFGLQAVFRHSVLVERPILTSIQLSNQLTDYPRLLAVAAARDHYRRFEKSLSGRTPTEQEKARLKELREDIGRAVLDIPEASGGPGPFTSRYDGLMEVPMVTVLGHEEPELVRPVHILHRGDLDRPRGKTAPALPAVLADATGVKALLPDGPASRKELALWLTRPDHPLTARVMANRLWQWHFGRGIVATPNDFGKMGQPPTHPALLDWLATEFVARGWSVKAMHRLIMTSSTYQAASDFGNTGNFGIDQNNDYLWRFNRRRLEGEAVWDAIHAVAGTLNLQVGGPPVAPPLTDEERAALRYAYMWVVPPDPKQHSRRGLYILTLRNFKFPLFEVFDAPNSAVSSPGRDVSTVASQALWLLNNRTAWRQAQHLAARILRESGRQPEKQVTRLWQIALGRPPTQQEAKEAVNLLDRLVSTGSARALENPPPELAAVPLARATGLSQLCLAVFSFNEFLYID